MTRNNLINGFALVANVATIGIVIFNGPNEIALGTLWLASLALGYARGYRKGLKQP